MKKIELIAFIAIVGGLLGMNYHMNKVAAKEADAAAKEYVSCLRSNYVQRDYCAKKVGRDYHVLDQQIKELGYSYEVRGYDLILVKNK